MACLGSTSSSINTQHTYTVCPMCHGSGHLNESTPLPPIDSVSKTIINDNIDLGDNKNNNNFNNSTSMKLKSPNTIKLPSLKLKSPSAQDFDRIKLDKLKKPKHEYVLKPQSAHSGGDFFSNDKADFVELLPPPFTLRNPTEALKYSLMQLNNDNWEIVMQGLGTIVQVSRTEPLLLEPHMTKVNQTLCNLLHTMRSHVSRYACQASRELFRTMQSTTRPEFDEIVQSLLQRTADMNKFIRHDANDALDAMVTYIPPIYSVRAIVDKGPHHKNALVRTAVARLLVCIVTMIQVQFLFTLPAYRETRKRIFDASALLMSDPNMTTRNTIKRLFEMFIQEDLFDVLFQRETDKKLLKKIDKALVCLKYKNKQK